MRNSTAGPSRLHHRSNAHATPFTLPARAVLRFPVVRAVWLFARFGCLRGLAVRAVWLLRRLSVLRRLPLPVSSAGRTREGTAGAACREADPTAVLRPRPSTKAAQREGG